MAGKHIQTAQRSQKLQHDKKATEVDYEIGDIVLVKNPQIKDERPKKLSHKWKGPYRITQLLNKHARVEYCGTAEAKHGNVKLVLDISLYNLIHYTPREAESENQEIDPEAETQDTGSETEGKIPVLSKRKMEWPETET